MSEQQTYYQKRVKCGKKRCKKCQGEGAIGHGPYWYTRQKEGDRFVDTYIGPHLPPNHIHIGRQKQSPLVGREQELSQLITAVEAQQHLSKRKQASAHQTLHQHILLQGEAGMGKTRLAEEIARIAAGQGWNVVWSRVYSQEGMIPYRLWTEVLRRTMTQGIWQRQEIAKRPQVFQPLGALLPEVNELMTPAAFPPPPEQEQLRLWEAAKELLILVSESMPLLIVLDDLQWADSSSCELLGYLAHHIHGSPIVIVATCRNNELGPDHPLQSLLNNLQRENVIKTILLEPLSNDQIISLVTQGTQVPEPMVQHITHRAAGNPFFAEELARTVENTEQDSLPDTISAVLTLRLNRLSEACQRLLSKAAILGTSFEFQVLCALEENTPGYDEDVVLELLEEALTSGILTEEGIGACVTYNFWHPLLSNHLYEKNSAVRRARQHHHAAEVFKKRYQGREEDGAAIITNHLVKGGADPQQIVHYAELAGNHAYSLSAYLEAESMYRIALTRVRTLQAECSEKQVQILVLLAECTRFQGRYEQGRQFYEQALNLCSQPRVFSSEEERSLRTQDQALLWCEVGFSWYRQSEWIHASQCYRKSEELLLAEEISDPILWAHLRYRQGYLLWFKGTYNEALPLALEALDLLSHVHPNWTSQNRPDRSASAIILRTLAHDTKVGLARIHQLIGLISNAQGNYTETIDHWTSALAIFDSYEWCKRDLAIVYCNLGDVYLRQAAYELARPILHRALLIAEQIGEGPLAGAALGNLGILALRRGTLGEAEEYLQRGIVHAEKTNDRINLCMIQSYKAIVLLEQGDLLAARRCVHSAFSLSRTIHVNPCSGFALLALGMFRLRQAVMESVPEERTSNMQWQAKLILLSTKAFERVLALENIESETRTEARLCLAHVHLMGGHIERAHHLTSQSLDEAFLSRSPWLIARAQRIIGRIFSLQNLPEQAAHHFEQALQLFLTTGMRLEYARTCYIYGASIHTQRDQHTSFTDDAKMIVEECGALLDKRLIEHGKMLF